MSRIKVETGNVTKKLITNNKLKQSNLNMFFKLNNKNPLVFEEETKLEEKTKRDIPLDSLQYNNKFLDHDNLQLNDSDLLKLERETIPNNWFKLLSPIFKQSFFLDLKTFISAEYASHTIFPPMNEIYSFAHLTNLENIKCIIIGQDPYHNEGQAHGLAFSIKNSNLKSLPPSLKNIYKAVRLNYPEITNLDEKYGNLQNWSKQGVLLTNRLLTVMKNKPLSHKNKGWETFQDQLLINLVTYKLKHNQKMVFMLWGDQAKNTVYKNKQLMQLIKENKDGIKIIENVHPSPLSCNRKVMNPVTKERDFRPWFDKRDFKECNKWLVEGGLKEINWGNI